MLPLHIAKTVKELEEKAELPKKFQDLKLENCLDKMKKLHDCANEANKSLDQEKEYTMLYRYFLIMKVALKCPEFRKNKYRSEFDTSKRIINKLEELKEILGSRYRDQEKNKQNSSIQPSISPAPDNTIKKISHNKIPDVTNNTLSTDRKSISSSELHSLASSKNPLKDSYLVIDTRSSVDYKESHLIIDNVINIPEEVITPGISASVLTKSLPQDIKEKWQMRGKVKKLIIFDWNRSDHNIKEGIKLFHLREAMTKWDLTPYESPPLILNGGYEDILATYPHITSNSKVKPPQSDTINLPPSLDSFDYPMQVLEPEVKIKPQPVVPPVKPVVNGVLVVDRSTKPVIQDEQVEDKAEEAPIITEVPELSNLPEKMPDTSEPSNDEIHLRNEPENQPLVKPMDDSSESVSSDPKQMLSELRKVKPDIAVNTTKERSKGIDPIHVPKVDNNISINRTPQKRPQPGITRIPVKKEDGPSGGGILKRSSSSPNIAQMDDEGRMPSYTRANKPAVYEERADSTYGKTAVGLTGLKNFANNCYMNSILQCLSNTKPLVSELISINKQLGVNYQSKTKGKIAQEVITAFRHMWSGDIRVYSIKDLKNIIGGLKDIFKGNGHQDSNEFLIILLEYLHEDLNIPATVESRLDGSKEETGERAWGEFRRKNCSIIQRLFYGQHRSTVSCSTCDHSSVTFEQFFNLYVPIPSRDTITLNDCIQLYMSGEKISGWKCPKCKEERNAIKKFDISRLPPILVIALKRFTNEEDSWLQKKENLVTYPLEGLDMERFTIKGSEQRYRRYNLYAMSTHTGTLRAGHYKAICKNYITDKWYMFDDQSVDPLHANSVRNIPEVYILFYSAELSNC